MLEFPETVLCDLNRCIQDARGFECHAFQPFLELVGSPEERVSGLNNGPKEEIKKGSLFELLNSDKIKYEKALALQRLCRDPDGVYVQLKYHLCWNVSLRRALFRPANDFIESVHDHFLRCSEMVRGFVELLYLAPDHVHLYVESDGELSIEEMVQRIKRFTNEAMLEEFPSVRGSLGDDTDIWDEAYFVETVG
jgi:REP element-mobilizing transposase RayT